MKQFLSILLLLSWFLAVRMPEPDMKGVWVQMLVGPFSDKKICETYKLYLLRAFSVLDDAVVSDCKETI